MNRSRTGRGVPGSIPGGTLGLHPVIRIRMPLEPMENSVEHGPGGPRPVGVAVVFVPTVLASVAPYFVGLAVAATVVSLGAVRAVG